MKLKRSLSNIVVGILSQIVIMALGIVVPRFVLVNYGSEVNGLFNSVSQIYSYLALLEAGVGASTLQFLYKHIGTEDKRIISSGISAAHDFYKKVSFIYLLFTLLFGLVFAYAAEVNTIPRLYILLIFWIQGLAGVVNFRFVAAEKLILTAEGKSYITSSVSTIFYLVTAVTKIVLVNLQINIVLLQTAYCMINLTQLLFYFIYFKTKYKWLDLKAQPNKDSLKEKNSFLIIEVAWTVFSCTDMVILSFMCDFNVVSVYAIYNLVFSSLSNLLYACYSGTQYVLSRSFHEKRDLYKKYHDCYESIFIMLIFLLMSVCYILILPFVRIYTRGITDVVYVDRYLPILFCLIQLLTWSRYVAGNLCNISGQSKIISKVSILETVINITVSLIMTYFWGIYGVLIGTIVALLYKSNYLIFFANIRVLKRLPIKTYKTIAVNAFLFVCAIHFTEEFDLHILDYHDFLSYSVAIFAVSAMVFFIVNIFTSPNEYWTMFGIVKKTLKLRKKSNRKDGKE